MEVTARCIALLANVLLLLVVHRCYCSQKKDEAFPRIIPNRLQFFLYDNFTIVCDIDGLTEWRATRKVKENAASDTSGCWVSAGSCTVYTAFKRDSGEYWCETEHGERSNALNVSVTVGDVILEIPPLPVMEGDNVTLRCRKKKPSEHIAEFYKDGIHKEIGYKGEMTIESVSKSDEGPYKCNISGVGESPESWLTVRKNNASGQIILPGPHEDTPAAPEGSSSLFMLLPIIGSLLVVLLLLMMGRVCLKSRVSADASVADPHQDTYAVVRKDRKKEASLEPCVYSQVRKPTQTRVPSTSIDQHVTDGDVLYTAVGFRSGKAEELH
ncbi:low affinity immunoglobulin gamma Fc region receptor III-A-like isoform X2 [Genypterus blacodes]|uniref:low affinity immunoglobulin gamma Fc region receptor III-A-like isoform X2 n=1 Tax=Genypterus blacodes TaxID=154954 RepID=UPI003F771118